MKKTYTTPVVTASNAVRETLAGPVITRFPEVNKSITTSLVGLGFGL